jgi:flagellar P-ring protein precursor FlgI
MTRNNQLTINLNQPDFNTASRLVTAINAELGSSLAYANDAGAVTVLVPADYQSRVPEFVVRLDNLQVTPDVVAKVVVNERTGTVVVGSEVTILPVAAAHAGLTVEVSTQNQVSQPPPASKGATVVVPQSKVTVTEGTAILKQLKGATVQELVRSLNAIKASPADIIAILQAVKRAGALQAELEII